MAKRTASAKKQARASVKRALRNRAVKSEVKTLVVKARKSLSGGPVAESDRYALTLEAVKGLDWAAAKGVLACACEMKFRAAMSCVTAFE